MRDLIRLDTTPADFVSPGHVFPLVANPAGVMGRQGQTEGSYDLAILSELAPSAVICEILNHDGTMARGVELNQFAELHKLKIISVEQLMRYRIEREVLVRKVACNVMSTSFGEFETHVFEDDVDDKEHLALCYGDVAAACSAGRAVPVRIHSECLTGDVFGSQRCDCGAQLQTAMEYIIDHGVGILLYLRQEGRGIGLANKLRAYQLQDQGRDTVEANVELGFEADARDFAVAAKMLMALEIEKVQLLTNNPRKLSVLDTYGISVAERIPLIEWSESCAEYLRAKKSKLGHLL